MVLIYLKDNFAKQIKQLESYTPRQFYQSQWQKCEGFSPKYVAYRWLIFLLFGILLLCSMNANFNSKSPISEFFKFFIYLTHWGFILCTLQTGIAAYLVTDMYFRLRKQTRSKANSEDAREYNLTDLLEESISPLCETYWIMSSVSIVCAFGITIIFWSQVYDPNYYTLHWTTFMVHGMNAFLMLVEILVAAQPLKFSHVIWTFAFVLIYLIFSFVYYVAGGTNRQKDRFIYPKLNWDNPKHALIFCATSFAFGFVIHVTIWLTSMIVRYISGASQTATTQRHVKATKTPDERY